MLFANGLAHGRSPEPWETAQRLADTTAGTWSHSLARDFWPLACTKPGLIASYRSNRHRRGCPWLTHLSGTGPTFHEDALNFCNGPILGHLGVTECGFSGSELEGELDGHSGWNSDVSRGVWCRRFSLWGTLLATHVLQPRARERTKSEIRGKAEPESRREKKGKESGKGGRRQSSSVEESKRKKEIM